MITRAYFVTGTDTGVGKTVVAAGLLHAAHARGLSTLGLKPVATGGTWHDGTFRNEDGRLLQQAASIAVDYQAVNPVALPDAIAPHITAAREQVRLSTENLAAHCREQLAKTRAGFAVAEGAGGWLVPLDERTTIADLAMALGWPIVLVVALRLGCLNHALLTAMAIAAAELPLAGWVANRVGEPMVAEAENIAALDARLGAPRLGTLPQFGSAPHPEVVARYLDLAPLL